jgi:hypothetical protein
MCRDFASSGSDWFRRLSFPEALAVEFDAIGVEDETVENGIGDGRKT